MKDLIDYIATSLVDDPSKVHVDEYKRGDHVVLKLHVARKDMGRVIGRNGRVANAMRTLLKVPAAQAEILATLDIVEPK